MRKYSSTLCVDNVKHIARRTQNLYFRYSSYGMYSLIYLYCRSEFVRIRVLPTKILEPIMSETNCRLLSVLLDRYAEDFLSYSTLNVLVTLLAVISAIHILLVFACKACRTISWCSFILVAQLIASSAFIALYIGLSIRIDRLSLNTFASNKDQLKEVVSNCTSNLPSVQFRFDSATHYNFGNNKDAWYGYIIVVASCVSFITGMYDCFMLSDSNPTVVPNRDQGTSLSTLQKCTLNQLRVTEQQCAQLSKSDVCPICLDEMNSSALSILACDHVFHEACLAKWMATAKKPSCPMCKANIEPSLESCKEEDSCCTAVQSQALTINIV